MDRSPSDEIVPYSPLDGEIPSDPVLLDLNADELANTEQIVADEVDNISSNEDLRFDVTSPRDVDADTDSDDNDGLYHKDTLSEAGLELKDDGFGNNDDRVIVASDAYS